MKWLDFKAKKMKLIIYTIVLHEGIKMNEMTF